MGLSKYFPGLRRDPAETPNVTSASRPAWSWFARRPTPTQVYMTDARSGLNQGMAEASALPVSLQVPSSRASDSAVTPANGERLTQSSDPIAPTTSSDPEKSAARPDGPPLLTDFVENPPRQGNLESNPLPPADRAEPDPTTAAVNRMPEIPPVDPRERPRLSSTAGPAASTVPGDRSTAGQKSDNQAMKAVPATPGSAVLSDAPEPTLTAFFRKMGSTVRGTPHYHPTTVLASPQSLPSPQVVLKQKPRPSPQVAPSPQVKPSAQVIETCHDCVCENCGAKICKKPCFLKRWRKAIFQGGTTTIAASPQH
jgi:hypothetical protein